MRIQLHPWTGVYRCHLHVTSTVWEESESVQQQMTRGRFNRVDCGLTDEINERTTSDDDQNNTLITQNVKMSTI
jgi:hypothetical protein